MQPRSKLSPTSELPTLFLFSTDPGLAVPAIMSGVNYIIVDWERGKKLARQAGTGFQIGKDTVEDAKRLAIGHDLPVFVRINALGQDTASEIALALDSGCRGIMLPMARSRDDVCRFLALVPKDVHTLIQIETEELAADPLSIADLPWDFAHVGLNDLMLARRKSSIWTAVLDGTVERICRCLEGRSYGFGGITVVDGGSPIAARLVMLEMSRLACSMGILRRSFTADVAGRNVELEVSSIRRLLADGTRRDPNSMEQDRSLLEKAIEDAGG